MFKLERTAHPTLYLYWVSLQSLENQWIGVDFVYCLPQSSSFQDNHEHNLLINLTTAMTTDYQRISREFQYKNTRLFSLYMYTALHLSVTKLYTSFCPFHHLCPNLSKTKIIVQAFYGLTGKRCY